MNKDLMQSSKSDSSEDVKVALAEMLSGGVIMDVTGAEQAKIAQEAGAVAVMALQDLTDIRAEGGVARMAHPELIQEIQEAVTIPVMAKCRIGHFVEAQILEALFVDFIDESEVLSPADEENYIHKHEFRIPFVCGCRSLGDALRRIGEGAAMISTKGAVGSGDILESVRILREINRGMRKLATLDASELMAEATRLAAPYHLVEQVARTGELPVPLFAAGGIATPADAALMMQLGAKSIFVGPGIFRGENPAQSARAIVLAISHYQDSEMLAQISCGLLGEASELDVLQSKREDQISTRGW